MGDDRPGAEHRPTLTEVPPADSIGRYLCEVTCSCGLFGTTALGRDAESARADALHSFDSHRDRAGEADPPAGRPRLQLVPTRPPALAPSPAPQPPASRRGVPLAAVAAVTASVVAVVAVLVAAVLVADRDEYAGAPTLVGGPDRTGPADLATTDAAAGDAPYTTERGDRYDELRERSRDVELWSDDRIDQVTRQICGLARAGRTVTEMVDDLAADGLPADEKTVRALRAFAQRLDC